MAKPSCTCCAILHQEGATICMVTHDTRFARHAERTIHLFDGRVVEEEAVEASSPGLEGDSMNDLRYAVRMLCKNPVFTAVAVVVLALAIGGNSAMFSVVNALVLRPLTAKNPEALVGCYSREDKPQGSYRSFSYPNYLDLREQNTVFTSLLAHTVTMVGVGEGDTTRRAFAGSFRPITSAPSASNRERDAISQPRRNVPGAPCRWQLRVTATGESWAWIPDWLAERCA